MKTDTAAEYLIRKLDEQRETVKSEVIRQALTHDEYARLRGVVQGLDFARELIKDLAREIETSDE
jgi:hypothetical protein